MKVEPIRIGATFEQAVELFRQIYPKGMAFVEALPNGEQILNDWLTRNPNDQSVSFRGYHSLEDHSVVNRKDYDLDVGDGECYTGVDNFIFIRRAGIVINTIRWANHSRLMSGCYTLECLENDIKPRHRNWEDSSIQFWMGRPDASYDEYMQDQFLFEGLGFYQSSCARLQYYKHIDYKLTRKEKAEFEYLTEYNMTFDGIDFSRYVREEETA